MSELMDAVKLLEDAMNERANLDTLIERLENELFRLVQRGRAGSILSPGVKHTWTPKADDQLLSLLNAGMTYRAAAAKMGMTINQVAGRATRLKKNNSTPRKIGRPRKSATLKSPFFMMTPEQRREQCREWGRKGKQVAMANRAAKQNGSAVAAE